MASTETIVPLAGSGSFLPRKKSSYLTVRHGKSLFFMGKPSISMGHLYHGKLLNNQRVKKTTSETWQVKGSRCWSPMFGKRTCWDTQIHVVNAVNGCSWCNKSRGLFISYGGLPILTPSHCCFWLGSFLAAMFSCQIVSEGHDFAWLLGFPGNYSNNSTWSGNMEYIIHNISPIL